MPVLYATQAGPVAKLGRVLLTCVAPSGTPSVEFLRFTFSDDNGATWTEVRFAGRVAASPGQLIQLYDYEAPPNTYRVYAVQSIRVLNGADVISARSVLVGVESVQDSWWLKDPLDPVRNMRVQVYRSGDTMGDSESTERREDYKPIGRKYDSTVSDVIEGERFERTFTLYGDVQLDAFEILRERRRILLLQDMHGRGKRAQHYVRLGKTRRFSKLMTQGFETDPIYRVTVEMSERPRP